MQGVARRCWVCGKNDAKYTRDITTEYMKHYDSFSYPLRDVVKDEHQRCYCKKCYAEKMQELRDENELYIKLKRKRMFESALDKMERQQIDFEEYREAIKAVEEYNLENKDKFDSSYEIMAAIVLIHNRVKIKPQFKVGRYQVDFLLSNHHIIVEIDGERHKSRKSYDRDRDTEIKKILGDDWMIIRIQTEHLDKDVKQLVNAINKVIEYRQTGKINWRTI